ncbi:MAG: spore cortex biosynthesis protein YabQ [Ruminococcus sp.]|nr:spore cortex biosynthesis protein YabQ [Ruminococcus sp.]
MNVPETFFSVREELTLFGLSCLAGAVIGLCYDALRAFRLMLRHGVWLTALEDIVFLALYAVFLSAFASAAARGELRFYHVVGNALGFTLYFFTLGSIIIRIFRKLFGALAALIRAVTSPIRRLYVLLRKKAGVKFVGSSKILRKAIKMLNLVLPNRGKVRYNIMENIKRKNVNNVAKKN